MRVLLAVIDPYRDAAGAAAFYTDLIAAYPEHSFCYFTRDSVDQTAHPVNAQALVLSDLYRAHGGSVRLEGDGFALEDVALAGKESDILFLMDLAESATGQEFDVVDIPDFLPLAALLPCALRQAGITFDRVVLSLHGGSSDIPDERLDEPRSSDLSPPGALENALFRSTDVRYGIVPRRLAEWERATGLAALLFDIGSTIDQDFFRALRAGRPRQRMGRTVPRPVYVGPQQRATGADLFVELVAGVPPHTRAGALVVGPARSLNGADSREELSRMARRRRMELEIAPSSRSQWLQGFAGGLWLGLFPSRTDYFSRVAIEALLCGAPTVISERDAASAFLSRALPDIPCVRIDPGDAVAAQSQVIGLIAEFDRERERLARYLETAELRQAGHNLDAIYGTEATPDPAVRQRLTALFGRIAAAVEAAVMRSFGDALQQSLPSRLGENSATAQVSSLIAPPRVVTPEKLAAMFGQFRQLEDIAHRVELQMATTGPLDDAAFAALSVELGPLCYAGNRILLYQLLAEIEGRRGNELLHATYQLRTLRLSGRHHAPTLDTVCDILGRHDFAEEAVAARMLYGADEDVAGMLANLRALRDRFRQPPPEVETQILDRRSSEVPGISIIVSLYNAADKLPIFLRGITQLPEATRRVVELIFVDSNSSDGTRQVISELCDTMAEHAALPLSILYVRTAIRETIQRAWNRGIVLARGPYLALLGVDESIRPDSFDVLAGYLDRHPAVDWVQGSALITQVDKVGCFVRDVMPYNRDFDSQTMHYLDCCYIGYVGGLYRRSVHDRVGFYDDRFRAAGDVEFKNRALPVIRVVTLPECLGFFRNYPEVRTTESPTAELEDLRAWYLHRSLAGVAYAFDDKDAAEAADLFIRCLGYRKTYMEQNCTDLELAATLGRYLAVRSGRACDASAPLHAAVKRVRDLYRVIDGAAFVTNHTCRVRTLHNTAKTMAIVGCELAVAAGELASLGVPIELGLQNDNRFHQHQAIWGSRLQVPVSCQLGDSPLVPGWCVRARARAAALATTGPPRQGTSVRKFWIPGNRRAASRRVAEGDHARSKRDWRAAAAAYRSALDIDPSLGGIWVQLGHALKEQGDLAGAEAAYRHSLLLDAEIADSHLQLGHVLKLQAKYSDAADSYLVALALDQSVDDGRRELAGLGYRPADIAVALATGRLPERAAARDSDI